MEAQGVCTEVRKKKSWKIFQAEQISGIGDLGRSWKVLEDRVRMGVLGLRIGWRRRTERGGTEGRDDLLCWNVVVEEAACVEVATS